MCGRWGWDADDYQWRYTPGEFEELVAGAVEGDKLRDSFPALLISIVSKALGGADLSVSYLLGDDDGEHMEYGDDVFNDEGESPEVKRAKYDEYKRNTARMAEAKQREWLSKEKG